MKKSGFKPSHNKRKINDNGNRKIIIKKQIGYTKRKKISKISFQKRYFLDKNISGFIFHRWPDKGKNLIEHTIKNNRHKEILEKINYEVVCNLCFQKHIFLFSRKTSGCFSQKV